ERRRPPLGREPLLWTRRRGARRGPRGEEGRGAGAPRPLRLRQDDDPAPDRRLRGPGYRHGRGRWPAGRGPEPPHSAGEAAGRYGLPGLRPLPPPHDRPERRLRSRRRQEAQRPCRRGALPRPPRRPRRQDAPRAFRRSAAAGCARPGARAGSRGRPARRALLEPRRRAQDAREGGDARHPHRRWRHGDLRHPRPGGGPEPRRRGRRDARRRRRPEGRARGPLPRARQPRGRRVRRRGELYPRHPRERPPELRARGGPGLRRVHRQRRGHAPPGGPPTQAAPQRRALRSGGRSDSARARVLRPRSAHKAAPRLRPSPLLAPGRRPRFQARRARRGGRRGPGGRLPEGL
ncbi:MAG: Putrescine transport ATP-binding protein PotA, partial [uncultured Rubrobacteraceae bacterium]